MGAWVWFVIAAVAAAAGGALLLIDRGQQGSRSRERRRWAALRGWQFAEEDAVLPDRWRHGVMPRGGSGAARDLVTGSLFTAAGRRLVHVFDHEQDGASSVLAAVHRRAPQAVVLELWLPTVEFPADAGLDLLGPVGDRYAFTSDLVKARPLITPELVALADDVGDDVPVMWIEDAWVVASVALSATPSRLERLLRLLGDVADLVDGVHAEDEPARNGPRVVPRDVPRDAPQDADEDWRDVPEEDWLDVPGDDRERAPASGSRDVPGSGSRDAADDGSWDDYEDGSRDEPADGSRDEPDDGTRDRADDGTRGRPGDGSRDEPDDGTRDRAEDGSRDEPADRPRRRFRWPTSDESEDRPTS